MSETLEECSTVTAKGQTTVPKAIRRALGVEAGDRIAYRVADGRVTLHRLSDDVEDPVIGRFLSMLASDMVTRPEALQAIPASLVERARALSAHVAEDFDGPIEGYVDL